MSELKPCPFCGGKAIIERVDTSGCSCVISCEDCGCSCVISCEDCGCTIETSDQHHNSGKSWNNRVEVESQENQTLKQQVAELVDVIERMLEVDRKNQVVGVMGEYKEKGGAFWMCLAIIVLVTDVMISAGIMEPSKVPAGVTSVFIVACLLMGKLTRISNALKGVYNDE